ncbi:unnamed protein product [Parajaminaea phylloscopi]
MVKLSSTARRTEASRDQLAVPRESHAESIDIDSTETDINSRMRNPQIYSHVRKPRHAIVLCHGLYGFDFRGPFWGLEIHYWAAVLDILRKKIGADVLVRGVPGTGSIASRAQALHEFLCSDEAGIRGAKVNFVGHSMGGLDARYLVSHLRPKPEEYIPVSVTSISTPHKGSPFMDWCNANVGIGNEYVEDCIREYQLKKGMWRSQAGISGHEQEAEKLPYSLKTPLFVRPKKNSGAEVGAQILEAGKNQEEVGMAALASSTVDQVKETAAEAVNNVLSSVESPSSSDVRASNGGPQAAAKERSDEKAADSKASIDVVTPLTRALSSLTGYFSSYMLSVLDQPAYAMLSTRYMSKVFNPSTPDMPNIKYFSVAARTRKIPLWHPLWLPKVILDAAAEARTAGSERDGSAAALGDTGKQGNDGLVSVESAKWGTFLGVVDGCDHWDLRGGGAPRWGTDRTINPATGKPWRSAKEAQKAEKKEAEMKAAAAKAEALDKTKGRKQSEDGWLAINRLLRTFVGSRSTSEEGGQQAEQSAQQGPAALASDQASTASADDSARSAEQQSVSQSATEAAESIAASVLDAAQDAQDNARAFLEQHVLPSQTGDSKPATSAAQKSPGDGQPGFMDEVASWISDRLPQGNEERRLLADQTAREQEKGLILSLVPFQASTSALSPYCEGSSSDSSSWAGSDVHAVPSAGDSSPMMGRQTFAPTSGERLTLASSPTFEHAHVPVTNGGLDAQAGQPTDRDSTPFADHAPSPLVEATQAGMAAGAQAGEQGPSSSFPPTTAAHPDMKLRREAGWLEDSSMQRPTSASSSSASQSTQPRHLRREVEWHRDERDRRRQRDGQSASQPASQQQQQQHKLSGSEKTARLSDAEAKSQNEKERLERFWIALCQHLHAHGL